MNKEIYIKDNFLPKSFFNHIQNLLHSKEIDWRYSRNATDYVKDDPVSEDYYFSHTAYGRQSAVSPHFNTVQPILYFIEDKFNFEIRNLMRVNFTFITQRYENSVTQFHIDFDEPHYVAILYLNNCNGPTLIEDKRVDFVENRLVLFDGNMKHAAVTQTDNIHRMNIVMNFDGVFI